MKPTEVSESAALLAEGTDGQTAFVLYDVLGWRVKAWVHLAGPILDGPTGVEVSPHGDPEGYDRAEQTDGVTTSVLRAVPLQHARRRLARIKTQARGKATDDTPVLPDRLESPYDWAYFAKVYADAVAEGQRRPLETLSRVTGRSRNTLSARVRRARELGLLTRPAGTRAAGELTSKAKELLRRGENGQEGGTR